MNVFLHTTTIRHQDTCWAQWFCVLFSLGSPTPFRQMWGARPLQVSTGVSVKLRGDNSIAEELLILILLIHKQFLIKQSAQVNFNSIQITHWEVKTMVNVKVSTQNCLLQTSIQFFRSTSGFSFDDLYLKYSTFNFTMKRAVTFLACLPLFVIPRHLFTLLIWLKLGTYKTCLIAFAACTTDFTMKMCSTMSQCSHIWDIWQVHNAAYVVNVFFFIYLQIRGNRATRIRVLGQIRTGWFIFIWGHLDTITKCVSRCS